MECIFDPFWFDFETKTRDKRGLNEGTILGIILEYFEAVMVLNNRKSTNGDLLEFDDPYDGFAMFAKITIEDAGVKK